MTRFFCQHSDVTVVIIGRIQIEYLAGTDAAGGRSRFRQFVVPRNSGFSLNGVDRQWNGKKRIYFLNTETKFPDKCPKGLTASSAAKLLLIKTRVKNNKANKIRRKDSWYDINQVNNGLFEDSWNLIEYRISGIDKKKPVATGCQGIQIGFTKNKIKMETA